MDQDIKIFKNQITSSKDIINPYRSAFGLLKGRLKWDLSLTSFSSRRKLKKMRNKFEGKKAVILCNGPSLNKVDFDLLKDTYTFGMNKINLLFDRSNFRPSCIVSVNQLVIEQNKDYFNETDIPLFVNYRGNKFVKSRDNVVFLHSTQMKTFARDCSMSINQGGTVTFVAMQLAFHMGFKEVALVGCDHYFKETGPANATINSKEEDDNHFDKRYFSGDMKWQLPDIPQSEYSYNMANDQFNSYGKKIYNCTEGGHLEIFERKTLKEFLGK